ncbi:hypothetical protein MSAN_01220600 [Mycena sanguinolenta]|uniref:Uncharacterized protein n=1 Tax=Mycena sanguinolenta TaxID=230812 RepID=A0A8H7D4T5_9AGAR|nr:hypothetical protein MSAN_01220600 [Mycena sanguinolenta]
MDYNHYVYNSGFTTFNFPPTNLGYEHPTGPLHVLDPGAQLGPAPYSELYPAYAPELGAFDEFPFALLPGLDAVDQLHLPTVDTLHIPAQNASIPMGAQKASVPRVDTPTLDAPASDASTEKSKGKKGRKAPTYIACELFDILQTGIQVKFFTPKYGEKGAKEKEFGNAVRALGIKGSDGVLKTRLLELLTFHEDPESAPAAIRDAITGTSYQESFGAPLDLLAAQKRLFENASDAEKEKLLKPLDGSNGCSANSLLNRSRRSAPVHATKKDSHEAENSLTAVRTTDKNSDEVPNASALVQMNEKSSTEATSALEVVRTTEGNMDETVDTSAAERAAEAGSDTIQIASDTTISTFSPLSSTPVTPQAVADWTTPSYIGPTDYDSSNDSDLEITGYKAAASVATEPVEINSKPVPPPTAAPSTTTPTPLPSIPRSREDNKDSTKKRIKNEDSDSENVAPSRSTKRVRKAKSFDFETFALEERQLRQKFEDKMLQEMKQSNEAYRQSSEDTRTFQTQFLGLLQNVFGAKDY